MHFLEIHADNWYDIIRYATQLLNLTQMPGLITALPGWHVRWASWRSGIKSNIEPMAPQFTQPSVQEILHDA